MVIYLANTRRCRVCGRRMLLWRWRWAHRRCATTRIASSYEPPSQSLLLPRQELDQAGAATIPPPATSVPPPPCGPTDAHAYQEYNEHGNTCHHPGCRLTWDEHPQEVTTLGDIARGERVYINADGSQHREAAR